jgi:nitrate/TMAO reductase-like tetraheme cytochrome c subunit
MGSSPEDTAYVEWYRNCDLLPTHGSGRDTNVVPEPSLEAAMALILLGAILIILVGGMPASSAARTIKPGVFTSSETCAECHEQIHSLWRHSMHGMSFSDPIFQVSYMRAYFEVGREASETCLRCHAPAAALTGDLEMQDPISREGITCDFCHSVAAVDLDRRLKPYVLRLDGVKRGPLGDAKSPVHAVAKSPLHRSAEFCAGCHEYSNSRGLLVLSTYSEWKASSYAKEGKTCQNCHMPLIPGSTVRAGLGVERREINLHNISGGHSSERVKRAAAARVLRVDRESRDRGVVEVEVANVGSGHAIPTGLPTRKLVLRVLLSVDGKLVRSFERTYQRVLLDAEGNRIVDDHRTILDAHTLLDDNRLLPGERRVETFKATIPTRGALSAEMHLDYLYEPELVQRQKMSISIASDRASE